MPPIRRRSPRTRERAARVAEVRVLAVLPEHRRQGVGRALIERCISTARADGATRVELLTHDVMTAAQALYAGLGFVPVAGEAHATSGAGLQRFALELGPHSTGRRSGHERTRRLEP